MSATSNALSERQDQIDQLKNELARLDGVYAQRLKELGLTEDDVKKIDLDSLPPDVKPLLEQARQAAAREGEDRAQAAKSQAAPTRPPSRRAGAVKV